MPCLGMWPAAMADLRLRVLRSRDVSRNGAPVTRVFLNAPAMRTREDVERYCERLGVVHTAGYRAVDGLRVMVELPEVAMDGVANEARALLAQTPTRMAAE